MRIHAGQARGDVEAVDVREVDVEEDELGLQLAGGLQGRRSTVCLADDVESLGLEEQSRARAKGCVVVDDEHRVRHDFILPDNGPFARTGSRTKAQPIRLRCRLSAGERWTARCDQRYPRTPN